ncbi:MAG: TIGR03668 family PPOX class F420-dependent oxidoreductase [Candidatus Binatia bacterium]
MERFELSTGALRLIRSARVAHLATADGSGQPHVIPICFVFDGERFYSPIDEKPKRVSAVKLKRVRNIAENSNVALVIDRYDEDWRRLAYILIFGKARILRRGKTHQLTVKLLRRKYRQYRTMAIQERPMIAITANQFVVWGKI